jgi:hypothetical protein
MRAIAKGFVVEVSDRLPNSNSYSSDDLAFWIGESVCSRLFLTKLQVILTDLGDQREVEAIFEMPHSRENERKGSFFWKGNRLK